MQHPMEKGSNATQELLQDSLPVLLLKLSVPAVVATIATALYNLIDTYFIARFGSQSLAGAAVVFAVIALLQTVGCTIGMGAASILSQLLGQQKKREAQLCAGTGILLGGLLGVLILLAGVLFLKPIMLFMGATKTALPFAMEYGRYAFWAAPAIILQFVLINLLRAQGKVMGVMLLTVAAVVINILGNVLWITILGWKIAGAGMALLVSQMAGVCSLFGLWWWKKAALGLPQCLQAVKKEKKSRLFRESLRICKVGSPSLVRQGCVTVSVAVLNHLAGQFSDDLVCAMSVAAKIFFVVYAVAIGISQAYQPVAGASQGAGKNTRIKKAFLITLLYGTGAMSLLAVLLYWISPVLVRFLAEERQIIQYAVTALHMQCFAMPFVMLNNIANMGYQAAKKPWQAGIIASFRQGSVYLPVLYVLAKVWKVPGILAAQAVTDGLTFLLTIPFAVAFCHHLREEK